MKPPIALLTSTVLVSLVAQPSAIAQVLACPPPSSPDYARTRDCFPRFGRTNQGSCLRLDACSLNVTSTGVEFIYLLDGAPVQGWTNCQTNGWFVRNRYIPASSPAAVSMLDFICQSRRTARLR